MRTRSRGLVAAISLVFLGTTIAGLRADEREDQAIKAIEKAGGKVGRNTVPDGTLNTTSILLIGAKFNDATLKELIAEMKEIKSLKRLAINDAAVTDAGIKNLKDLKDLKKLSQLSLTRTQVTPASIKELQAVLPNCKILLNAERRLGKAPTRDTDGQAAPGPRPGGEGGRGPGVPRPITARNERDFIAMIMKISGDSITVAPQGSSDLPRPTLRLAKDAKILEGIRERARLSTTPGPAIAGGLQNEKLRMAVMKGALARVIMDKTGKLVDEVRIIMPPDTARATTSASLTSVAGAEEAPVADPLPEHAMGRFGVPIKPAPRAPGLPPSPMGVTSLAIAPDGKRLAVASHDGIRVWDTTTKRALLESDKEQLLLAANVAYAPDGKTLALTKVETIFLLDADKGIQRLLIPGQQRSDWVGKALAISLDSARIALATPAGWASVYNLADGKEQSFVRMAPGNFNSPAFSQDFRLIAGLPHERPQERPAPPDFIQVLELDTGKQVIQIPNAGRTIHHLAFSPDNRTVVDAGQGLRAFETASGRERMSVPLKGEMSTMALSPDGRRVAVVETSYRRVDGRSVMSSQVRVIDLPSGKVSAPLAGHEGRVTCLAFSADGRRLASGSTDGTAFLWDTSGLLPAMESTAMTAEERQNCWNDLASDAKQAYRSMWKLTDDPGAVEFLRPHLNPARGVTDPTNVKKLIGDLDNNEFAIRTRAREKLTEMGPAIADELRKLLAENPSTEVRTSVLQILEPIENKHMAGPRAVEILERINTPAAKEILERIAGGVPGAALTQEAKRSLARMSK